MTAVELADAIIARAQKPSRQGSKYRKLQWRLERYASTGPNCPNGHPWNENAKFNYRGYRRDHDKHKTVSLDVPLFDGSELRGIDRITTGLWQSESTWQ